MESVSTPSLADTLNAMTDWYAQKYKERYRKQFKEYVEQKFEQAIGSSFSGVHPTLAEAALNELCFLLAHSGRLETSTATINFSTICHHLITTIGYGAKRASKADIVSAMNALELMRLKNGK